MQDPLITLYAALKDNWALTGDLAAANIRFSTGWFEEAIDLPQIVIAEAGSRDGVCEIGYGTIRVRGTYSVDVWVPVQRASAKGPGKAKDQRWKIVEEVKRILKENKTGLTDIWRVALTEAGRSLDELQRTPPILRYNLSFSVTYFV